MSNVLIDEFETWVQRYGPRAAESTAKQYKGVVLKFQKSFGDPKKVGEQDILRWRQDIETLSKGGKASASTINVKIAAMRAFYQFLQSRKGLDNDPTNVLSLVRVPERLPKPLSPENMSRLLQEIRDTKGRSAVQDLAMAEIMFGSGLRREEVANLMLGQVEDPETLRIIGKGDKERLVPLTEPGYHALRAWGLLAHRDARSDRFQKEFGDDAAFEDLKSRRPRQCVFLGRNGQPIRNLSNPGNAIYKRMRKYGDRLGFHLSPHMLRHSYATDLLNNDADMFAVSISMGHASLRPTRVYTKVLPRGVKNLRAKHSRQRETAECSTG